MVAFIKNMGEPQKVRPSVTVELPEVEGEFVSEEKDFTEVLIIEIPGYGNDKAQRHVAADVSRALKVQFGASVNVYRTTPLKPGGCALIGDPVVAGGPVEPPTWEKVE